MGALPLHAILKEEICNMENVGGELDKIAGLRVTFATFPRPWTKGYDCIIHSDATVDPNRQYRTEPEVGA